MKNKLSLSTISAYWLFSLLILSGQNLSGQQEIVSPSVIGAAGKVSKNDQVTLEWTLGETFVQTISLEKGLHTQGYHQPNIRVKEFGKPSLLPYTISVFPNPVNEILNVSIHAPNTDKLKIKMTDVTGRNVLTRNAQGGLSQIQVNTTPLPAGIYLLSVTNEKGYWIRSFKIIKQS